ncbi:hypothetical protein JI664_21390 [Rhodobacter sp. NTK016B]|uniref:hypothetical protein n=1 Tax=Rhodobacter sp. NTK016B TaxID=2759676 RepID=UPI001A8E55F4|nr:hypothetical protein [Rhodobacter sp. NTK016B]MBN8294541.1 hypothetical protein [Rhodobacter sp. NTK016B]
MTFFANFVQGVFQGMDWRDNRKLTQIDAQRSDQRWEWEQEDREHTVSERERVAREREASRARAAAARARAQSQRNADLQALNATVDQMVGVSEPASSGSAPLTVREIVRDDGQLNENAETRADIEPTAPPRPRVSPHHSASNDDKLLPSRRQPDTIGGGAPMPASREPDRRAGFDPEPSIDSIRRDAGRRELSVREFWQNLAPEQQTMLGRVAPDGPVTAEQSVADQMPHRVNPSYSETPRPPAAAAEPVASPGSTPVPQRAVEPAAYVPPQSGASPFSVLQAELSRAAPTAPPASAPYDATGEQAVAAARATPRPQTSARYARSVGSAVQQVARRIGTELAPPARQRSQSQIDASLSVMHPAFRGEPIAPPNPTSGGGPVRRSGVAEEMQRQAQADRSAVGTVAEAVLHPQQVQPDPSMTTAERNARAALASQTPRAPASTAAPSQQAALSPTTPRRPGPAPTDTPPPQLPGPASTPTTPGGGPVGSVQSAQRGALSVLSNERTPGNGRPTPEQYQTIATAAEEDFRQRRMLPYVEHLMRTGRVQEAMRFEEWVNERGTREGIRAWARGMAAAQIRDADGLIQGLADAYEAPGYYDDGLSVIRDETSIEFSRGGDVRGIITFRDNATGRTFQREIDSMRDVIAMGVGTLAPENVWETMYSHTFGERSPAANAPEPLSNTERIRLLDLATETAGINATPEQIETQYQRLLQSMGGGASGIGAGRVPVMP